MTGLSRLTVERAEIIRVSAVATAFTVGAEPIQFIVWGLVLFRSGSVLAKLVWTLICGIGMGSLIAAFAVCFVSGRLEGLRAARSSPRSGSDPVTLHHGVRRLSRPLDRCWLTIHLRFEPRFAALRQSVVERGMVRGPRVTLMSAALLIAQLVVIWSVPPAHGAHEAGGHHVLRGHGAGHGAPGHDGSDLADHCPFSICFPSPALPGIAEAIAFCGASLVARTFADDLRQRTFSLDTDPPVPKRPV